MRFNPETFGYMNFYTDFKLKEIDEDVDKSLIVDFLEKREIDNRFNLQFNEKYRFLIFLRETSKKSPSKRFARSAVSTILYRK